MSKEMHLSLVIYALYKGWTWHLIDQKSEAAEKIIAVGFQIYDTFEECAKELNKISADFLPETDVYRANYSQRIFIGPLEMFSEMDNK